MRGRAAAALRAVVVLVSCASGVQAGDRPAPDALRPFVVARGEIAASLTGAPGDAARGRAVVTDRQVGLCLLCHSGPFPEERFQGDLAPDLAGVGRRFTAGQIRLRIVDGSRINPSTIMPPYYRIEGLERVGRAYRGRPILTAEQVEDVVAFLASLN